MFLFWGLNWMDRLALARYKGLRHVLYRLGIRWWCYDGMPCFSIGRWSILPTRSQWKLYAEYLDQFE